jgi:hypothetical protein
MFLQFSFGFINGLIKRLVVNNKVNHFIAIIEIEIKQYTSRVIMHIHKCNHIAHNDDLSCHEIGWPLLLCYVPTTY